MQLFATNEHAEHCESQGSHVWLIEMNKFGRGQVEEHELLNKTVPGMQVRHLEMVFMQEEHGDKHYVQLEFVVLVNVLLGQDNRHFPL